MNYQIHIKEVAESLAPQVDLADVYAAMVVTWNLLEKCASDDHYDVFSKNVRGYLESLGKNLYKIPGADPAHDSEQLIRKDAEYGGSWCKRGGIGAFMMMARKWDRVVTQVERCDGDILRALDDKRDEGILDDFGDLRRYVILIVSWLEARDTENARLANSVPF